MITGKNCFTWQPEKTKGVKIRSGVYYCKVQLGENSITQKLILFD
jgi:flagellar hook assembly protein FlgD